MEANCLGLSQGSGKLDGQAKPQRNGNKVGYRDIRFRVDSLTCRLLLMIVKDGDMEAIVFLGVTWAMAVIHSSIAQE